MYEMNFFLFGNVILEIVHSPRRRFRVSFNVTKPFISDILIGEQELCIHPRFLYEFADQIDRQLHLQRKCFTYLISTFSRKNTERMHKADFEVLDRLTDLI